MNFLAEIIIVVGLLANSYLLFFFTGGCVSLFFTALNQNLRANEKFQWMLAQTYFPPASIIYLAAAEKNRKFQMMGAISLVIAGYYPVQHLTNYHWGSLSSNAQVYAERVQGIMHLIEENDKKKSENLENHKQAKALTEKKSQLHNRLSDMAKASPSEAKKIHGVDATLMITSLSYITGGIAEGDYAEILNNLDTITAVGTLSDGDAQNWSKRVTQALHAGRSNAENMNTSSAVSAPPAAAQIQGNQLPAADPQRIADPLSRQAQQISAQMLTMYNASQDVVMRKALNDTDIALAELRSAYIYRKLPQEICGSLLNDLSIKISRGVLSPDDATRWISSARMLTQQAGVSP